MLFIAYCVDKEDHVDVRMATRPAHLDFMAAKGEALKLAGPTTGPDGETPNGSLIIFEDSSLEAAKEWIAGDPYAAADLFASVDVKPWKGMQKNGL